MEKFLGFFSKYSKIIIIGGIILAVLFFISNVAATGILFALFLFAVGMFIIQRQKNKKQARIMASIFSIVFLIHLLLAFFVYYANFQPFSGGQGDYNDYHIVAKVISERVVQGNFSLQKFDLPFGVSHYYPVIIGYIYAFTVPEMLIGQVFNAFVLALAILISYLLVIEIGRSEREAFWVSLIINFYPSLSFFSAIMLKDILVVFFSLLSLLFVLKLIKQFSWPKFFILYAALFGLTHFRFYVAYALMAALGISWILFSNLEFKKRFAYGFIMFLFLGLLPQITGIGEGYFAMNSVKRFFNVKTMNYYREVVYVEGYKQAREERKQEDISLIIPPEPTPVQNSGEDRTWGEDSSVIIKTGTGNPVDFVKNSIISFFYTLLGPFPWQLKQLKHLFVLPEVIPWYFALFVTIFGIVKSIRGQYKLILPLLLFSFFLLLGLSFFITNFGILTRIRIPAFLVLLCLLPFGFEKLKSIKVPFLEKYIFDQKL